MGCVFAYVIVLAILGPENLGGNFDVDHDRDLAEAAGTEALAAARGKTGARHDEEAVAANNEERSSGSEGEEVIGEKSGK